MAHIRAHSEEAKNEAFPAVARISALNQHLYDVFADRLIGQIRKLPTRDNPMGELDFDMEDGTV
jgi:hypothetical protein